jgi:hypothetical protein
VTMAILSKAMGGITHRLPRSEAAGSEPPYLSAPGEPASSGSVEA